MKSPLSQDSIYYCFILCFICYFFIGFGIDWPKYKDIWFLHFESHVCDLQPMTLNVDTVQQTIQN